MTKNYIGLAVTSHDPALAIVNSKGKVVFAEATERYLQNKRAYNAPTEDLIRMAPLLEKYMEKGADVVINMTWKKPGFLDRLIGGYIIKKLVPKDLPFQWSEYAESSIAILSKNLDMGGLITGWQAKSNNPGVKWERRYHDHHLTHATFAAYASPFEEAVCLVFDGSGERFISMAFYHYKNGNLTPLNFRIPLGHYSLGLYYEFICNALGFSSIKGEEWKVMGLASYGKFDEKIYTILKKMLFIKDGHVVRGKECLSIQRQIAAIGRKKGQPAMDYANFAFTAQYYFCELAISVMNNVCSKKISENLIFCGGCALNSSMNGQILDRTGFKNLFIPPAPADDGNAIGAALLGYKQDYPDFRPGKSFFSPYLGETLARDSLDKFIKYGPYKTADLKGQSIHEYAAALLGRGKIIGWAQGRAEFGPRALGNRSILADPRSTDIREKLNVHVKFREEFRPFAPSILHEFGDEYFEHYQESYYMERTLKFRDEVKSRVPGVVHVDGTGRLQTVRKEWNERYYDLIYAFYRITGIPLLLNTSFNVMGKPIIHSVEDAVTVFMNAGLDALVIEDLIFEKLNPS
ncbi:MAG: carbamoyltransferase [Oligoflexales bacterium]|nr:carbamoyltransferase [Oligoflexales bacterium]